MKPKLKVKVEVKLVQLCNPCLPGSLNSPWDTFLHWGPNTGGGAHMS